MFEINGASKTRVPVDSWRAWPLSELPMRIDDSFLSNVCFIGHTKHIVLDGATEDEISADMHWGGTGFFVIVFSECKRCYFHYLVTARHVALGCKGIDTYIRTNRGGGGTNLVKLESHQFHRWIFHPDTPEEVDVAVLPWNFFSDEFDIKAIDPTTIFLTSEIIKRQDVGPGDDVFAVGLLSKMTGKAKNFPIVRTGIISMMPDEKVPNVKIGPKKVAAEAYVIESRSIGGWSGSPVFVRPTLNVHYPQIGKQEALDVYGVSGRPYLLGLVNSHWEIPKGTENDVHLKPHDQQDSSRNRNTGLTIIVPAHKIFEVLYHPKMIEEHQKVCDKEHEDAGTVQDSEPAHD